MWKEKAHEPRPRIGRKRKRRERSEEGQQVEENVKKKSD